MWVGTQLYGDSVYGQYWTALYHGVLMLTGNDVGPRGNFQVAFVTVSLLLGAIINANIFGNMAVLLQGINRKASRFQEHIDTANTAMKNMKLPEEIQKRVQNYMMYTQSTLDHQKELDAFLDMISPSLRLEVTRHIFSEAIMKNEVLRDNTELIEFVVPKLVTLLYLPEDQICTQGDAGTQLFFLAKGECEVWVRDELKKDRRVKELKRGQLFGEVALLKNCRRTATVKSMNYCTCAALETDNFKELRANFPDAVHKLERNTRKYQDRWKLFLKRILVNIDFLACVSDEIVEELAYKLQPENFEQGTCIFKAGDACAEVLLVAEGEVEVNIVNNGIASTLDILYQGCSLGGYAVLNQDAHSVFARAKTNCTLLRLSRDTLLALRMRFDELDLEMGEHEDFVERSGVPYCDYKLFRSRFNQLTVKEKLRIGVRRIAKIVTSQTQPTNITDMLKTVQDQVLQQKREKEAKKRNKKAKKAAPAEVDAENAQLLQQLNGKPRSAHLQAALRSFRRWCRAKTRF